MVKSSTAFCDTPPSSLVVRYQHYRQMCCPHLQNKVSKKVPIKCWPIYQATWCHIPYSMLFQAVLAVMLLSCTWEWSNFNFGCDMSDFKAFHNFPVYGGKFPHQYLNYVMANFIPIHQDIYNAMRDKIKTCKKNEHMYVTEWHSLTFCIYAYTGHTIVHSG